MAAATDLQHELGEPGGAVDPPGAEDPLFRRYEGEVAALSPKLGTVAAPVSIDTFDPICGSSARVLMSYELAGAAKAAPSGATNSEIKQAQTALVVRNLTRYFDQMFPLMLFAGHCQAVHMPVFEAFARDLPEEQWNDVRKSGLAKMREGLFQTVLGLLTMGADPGIGSARQKAILDRLAADSGLLVLGLGRDARAMLLKSMPASLRTVDPTAAAKIEATFGEEACGSLCSH